MIVIVSMNVNDLSFPMLTFWFLNFYKSTPPHADQLPSDKNDSLSDWPQTNQMRERRLMLIPSSLFFCAQASQPTWGCC